VLLGRTTERARVERLLDDARQGRGGALLIRGEPGIGKTALLRYAIDLAEALTIVRATGVESETELEYSGLVELCQPILSGLDGLPEHQADALRGALGLSAARAGDRFMVGAATIGLLSLVAESRPLLVVVDDAQWLDAASADALTFAARRLAADPVAFLVGVRDGSPAFASVFDELELSGLDADTAGRLVERAAGAAVPDEVAARLYDATQGNPLALVELPRVLSAEQLAGQAVIHDPVPVGARVEQAYTGAIETCSQETRRALLALALSASGDVALIARALGSAGALEPAEDAGLVVHDGTRFVFHHPLVRSAVVQAAAPSSLREAHRSLADGLAAQGNEEEAAWHRAAAAVGHDEDAAAGLAAAAAKARVRGGFESASAAFERAARLTQDEALATGWLGDAAESSWSAGTTERATALVREALTTARHARARGRLMQLRGRIELQTATAEEARDTFVEGASLLEEHDPAGAAGILGLAVAACHHGGMMGDGLALAERARSLVPCDGGPADEQAAYVLGRALRLAGRAEDGSRILGGVLATMLGRSDAPLATATRASIAAASLERDAEARQLAGLATRLARVEGPMMLAQTLTLLAWTCMRQGEWERAVAAATEGLTLADELGQANLASFFLTTMVCVEAARGNEATCRAYAERARPLIEASGVVNQDVLVRSSLGLLELGLDRLDAAFPLLDAAARTITAKGIFGRDYVPEFDLTEALARSGKTEAARACLDARVARGGFGESAAFGALVARTRGLVAPGDAFETHFVQALVLHAQCVDPFGEARTRLCYGERLRRARRRVDARVELRAALETFERLDAPAWITRTRRELRATGEKLGRRTAASGDALTPQELQVALQVAEGKTNKEVGAALFLSPKTVEFHLARVYRKLDLSSRGELIRRFAAEEVPQPVA
jgi:DNA-binding CsgD family transcriptional regulator